MRQDTSLLVAVAIVTTIVYLAGYIRGRIDERTAPARRKR